MLVLRAGAAYERPRAAQTGRPHRGHDQGSTQRRAHDEDAAAALPQDLGCLLPELSGESANVS